jgi:hypothetical protein
MNSRAKTWAVKNAPTKNETTIKPADMSTSINLTKKPWTKTDVNNSKSKSRDRISLSSTRTRAKAKHKNKQASKSENKYTFKACRSKPSSLVFGRARASDGGLRR